MWRQDTLHCQQQLGEISCPRMYTSGTFFAVMEKYDFSHQEHQRLKEHGPKLIFSRLKRLDEEEGGQAWTELASPAVPPRLSTQHLQK